MRVGRVHLVLAISFVSIGCLWIFSAKIVGPGVIESGYHYQSLPVLNRIITISGTIGTRIPHVLIQYFGFGLIGLILFTLLTSPVLFRKYVGKATPGTLGAIRMLTCSILLISTLWEDLASSALLPGEMRQPMGVLQLFYGLPIGFDKFVSSEPSLLAFKWLTALMLFLGAVGWRTRIVIPLGAFCYFLLAGILRQYAWFYHTGLVPIYVMAVLSLTPCGDGWSVDRLRRIWQDKDVPDADRPSSIYGWSRYACWVIIAMPYVAAGMSKVRNGGLLWWHPTNMKTVLFEDTLTPTVFDWGLSLYLVPAPDILFALLGIAAILAELCFVLVLVSRTARWMLPTITIFMHISILFLQNILFFDLILLQLVFFDFTRIRKFIGNRLAVKRGPIQVLYDGFCPLCRRTVRLLPCFDLFNRQRKGTFRKC